MRYALEAFFLLLIVSPIIFWWGRHHYNKSLWYADIRGEGTIEKIGLARDGLLTKTFIQIGDTLHTDASDYDQKFADSWANACSTATTRNAALRRSRKRK